MTSTKEKLNFLLYLNLNSRYLIANGCYIWLVAPILDSTILDQKQRLSESLLIGWQNLPSYLAGNQVYSMQAEQWKIFSRNPE